jgi:protein TonB
MPTVPATPIVPPAAHAKIQKQIVTSEKWTQVKVVDNTVKTDNVKTQEDLTKTNVDVTTNKSTDSVKTETKMDVKIGDDKPVTVADVMPAFPGGESKLFEYLRNNINYPAAARQNNTQGYVYVTFVVDKAGKISDVKLLRDIGDGCGDEAVRIIKKMPDWKPGRNNGEAVAVQYTIPINFRLK